MKYRLTTEVVNTGLGLKLYRIEALRDIPKLGIKTGYFGGFIESECNLSQEGDCWVFDNAWVYGDALISGNAQVRNHANECG